MYNNQTRSLSASTGIISVDVSPGKNQNIGVQDTTDDAVYDVIAYLYRADEKATRKKHVIETGVTGAYFKTSLAGFVEVGVEVTSAGAGVVELEILECKM